MKPASIFLFAAILVTLASSCRNERSAKNVLDDPEKQDEILTTTEKNTSLLAKLHDKMKSESKRSGDGHVMQSCMSMVDNQDMMSMMMDNMMMRCDEDGAMCAMMCDKMMGSENMKSIFMKETR